MVVDWLVSSHLFLSSLALSFVFFLHIFGDMRCKVVRICCFEMSSENNIIPVQRYVAILDTNIIKSGYHHAAGFVGLFNCAKPWFLRRNTGCCAETSSAC